MTHISLRRKKKVNGTKIEPKHFGRKALTREIVALYAELRLARMRDGTVHRPGRFQTWSYGMPAKTLKRN